MKLNLLLIILVILALVVVAALTLRAVTATKAVTYRGEAPRSAVDPSAAKLAGPAQAQGQSALESGTKKPDNGIDRGKQDLKLRAPLQVEYAYVILHREQLESHTGGCGGLPTSGMVS